MHCLIAGHSPCQAQHCHQMINKVLSHQHHQIRPQMLPAERVLIQHLLAVVQTHARNDVGAFCVREWEEHTLIIKLFF